MTSRVGSGLLVIALGLVVSTRVAAASPEAMAFGLRARDDPRRVAFAPSSRVEEGDVVWVLTGGGRRVRARVESVEYRPHPCGFTEYRTGTLVADHDLPERVSLVATSVPPMSRLAGILAIDEGYEPSEPILRRLERAASKALRRSIADRFERIDPFAQERAYFPLEEADERLLRFGDEGVVRRAAFRRYRIGVERSIVRGNFEWSVDGLVVGLIGVDALLQRGEVREVQIARDYTDALRSPDFAEVDLGLDSIGFYANVFDLDGDGRAELVDRATGHYACGWLLFRVGESGLEGPIASFYDGR